MIHRLLTPHLQKNLFSLKMKLLNVPLLWVSAEKFIKEWALDLKTILDNLYKINLKDNQQVRMILRIVLNHHHLLVRLQSLQNLQENTRRIRVNHQRDLRVSKSQHIRIQNLSRSRKMFKMQKRINFIQVAIFEITKITPICKQMLVHIVV